jgi:spore coat protein U-like protein
MAIGCVRPASAAGSCSITTVSNVAFGTYDVFSNSPVDSTGIIRIYCNGGARSVTVDLSKGNAPTYSPRYMLKAAEQLNYNLYLDAARTIIWGDATGGTSHYGPVDPPNKTNVDLTIYGRIPAGQDLSVGSYADTITATVNF